MVSSLARSQSLIEQKARSERMSVRAEESLVGGIERLRVEATSRLSISSEPRSLIDP